MIFDLDGVIVDSYAAVIDAINGALAAHGLPRRTPEALRHFIGPPTFRAFSELTGEPPDSPAVAEIVETYRARYGAHYLTQTRLIDGVGELLESLSRRRALAVATSKSVLFTEPLLRALGIAGHFVAVAAADPDDTDDDKTAIVARALAALDGLSAVMVGDRSFDILAARRHDLTAIGVLWGIGEEAELRGAGADLLVATPAELLALLSADDALWARPPRLR